MNRDVFKLQKYTILFNKPQCSGDFRTQRGPDNYSGDLFQHFSRMFKRVTGTSPRQFHEKAGGMH